MNIEDVDVGEYDEADRNYNERLLGMYKYMVHIKPYLIEALQKTDEKERVADLLTIYANLSMTFGEFKSMTQTHIPNLAYKRKFFLEATNKFNGLLGTYRNLVKNDRLVLTEAEKKLVLT